jgi:ATP-dependent DNA ligase
MPRGLGTHLKAADLKNLLRAEVHFIEPMYAKAVQKLPEGKEWIYEIKLDGYRALAGKGSSGVNIWSRRGNVFTDQFPRIAPACQRLQPETLIDGEIVALDDQGRASFNLVQHHRSQASAMQFYALTC